MASQDVRPSAEEAASFRFGGTRARPRKGIEATFITGQTYLKPPGSCLSKWPQLSIGIEVECCEGCSIYILDVASQVQISDCRNCRIVIGPCTGSVFLLNCVDCTVSVAAAQLRLRDVQSTELRAFAPTHESVVIEACDGLAFRAWDVAYPKLAEQFQTAGWAGKKNHWNAVYNFTPPAEGEPRHFELISLEAQSLARWCELTVESSGLASGSVHENVTATAATRPCECPCAAADGSLYESGWFSAAAFLQSQADETAAAAAPAAAVASSAADVTPASPSITAATSPDSFWSKLFGTIASWLGLGTPSPSHAAADAAATEAAAAAPSAPTRVGNAGESNVCTLQ